MPANSQKNIDSLRAGCPAQLSHMRLEQMRQEIDAIDRDLSQLLLRRLEIASAIGSLKNDLGLPVRDPRREDSVLEKVATRVSKSPLAKHIVKIYLSIVAEACHIQCDNRSSSTAPRLE